MNYNHVIVEFFNSACLSEAKLKLACANRTQELGLLPTTQALELNRWKLSFKSEQSALSSVVN